MEFQQHWFCMETPNKNHGLFHNIREWYQKYQKNQRLKLAEICSRNSRNILSFQVTLHILWFALRAWRFKMNLRIQFFIISQAPYASRYGIYLPTKSIYHVGSPKCWKVGSLNNDGSQSPKHKKSTKCWSIHLTWILWVPISLGTQKPQIRHRIINTDFCGGSILTNHRPTDLSFCHQPEEIHNILPAGFILATN